jgi:hypothetical protein
MVPRQGFEPWTSALPRMRSTTERLLTHGTPRRTPWAMPPTDKPPNKPPSERETKLAQALRANLRRRKAAGPAPVRKPAAKISDEG